MMIRLTHGVIFLLLLCFVDAAQAAFISDRLFLGIYETPDSATAPIRMLASGSEVEILETQGDFVRIKTADGKEGWARAEFVTEKTPSSVMIKQVTEQRDQLQAQLNAIGVTEQTVKRLQQQLAEANEIIKDLRKDAQDNQTAAVEQAAQQQADKIAQANELKEKLVAAEQTVASMRAETAALKTKLRASDGSTQDALMKIAWLLLAMFVSLLIGLILGAGWLARRVRKRFNGLKVW